MAGDDKYIIEVNCVAHGTMSIDVRDISHVWSGPKGFGWFHLKTHDHEYETYETYADLVQKWKDAMS